MFFTFFKGQWFTIPLGYGNVKETFYRPIVANQLTVSRLGGVFSTLV